MSSHPDESPVWEQLVWSPGIFGESRRRGGIDAYSRIGLWMGLWPNLAQFLNWEKALIKDECWLKANLLWICHPLPGMFSTLSLRHLPCQGRKMLREEALLFLTSTAWFQLLHNSHDQGRGGESSKWLTSGRRGNRTTHEDAPTEKARKSQKGVIVEEENNLNNLGAKGKMRKGFRETS